MPRTLSTILLSIFVLSVTFAAQPMIAADSATAKTEDAAARHLVRQIIEHELRAEQADQTHWMYLDRLQEPEKNDVKEVVQTNGGELELLTARNGRPVNAAERKKEMQKLQKLASDPAEQQNKMRAEREDGEKAHRMLKMLPDAFLYKVEATSGDRVTLSFRPDPIFHPSSHEAMVFHGMAGTLMLDTKERRLVEIRGHLIDEVKFGWGVLGHLDKGGQFLVKQAEIEPGCWEIAELDVQMSGKALFFKSIALHQNEVRTAYRRLPDDLPPQQGLAMLANAPQTVAQR